jgi:peptide/nickel transport system substrate-binding protein
MNERPNPIPRIAKVKPPETLRGTDGIRAKGGKRLKLVFQTSINAPRQKTQAIVKQACQRAGIDVELKSVTPSVYFSSDAANPDTARKFYADIQMLTTGVGSPPDPEGLMRQFLSSEVAAKENKWQRANATRWRSEAYDNLFHAAESELDPVKRAALCIAMNDMVVEAGVAIPVVCRPQVSAISKKLRAALSGWDATFWNLKDWYRQA